MIDLKRLRKEKGITQKELAQLLSCGQSFIANVENGRRDLPPVKIEILERKFGNICSYITNDIEEIKPIENKPKTIAPKQHSDKAKVNNEPTDYLVNLKNEVDFLKYQILR